MTVTATIADPKDFVIVKITHAPGKQRARLYAKAGKPVPETRYAVKLMTTGQFAALKEQLKPRVAANDDGED